MTARICADCPAELGAKNKSGRCRSCTAKRLNADPEMQAKRLAAVREYTSRPEVVAALTERLAHHLATMSEEERENRRAHGRRVAAANLHTPEAKAKSNSREAKARAGRARTNTVLADIPPAYRDRYRFLKETKLYRAAEARRLIAEEIATDERRRVAAMTPFERQLERVASGATLVTIHPRRSAELTFTPGGVATGML